MVAKKLGNLKKMTLVEMCDNWDGSKEQFSLIAKKAEDSNMVLHDMFTISIPTVKRWISGVANPHPIMMKLVVKRIRAQALNI